MVETNDGFKLAEVDLQLRGPGEFFGTRQSGLPEFRVADLLRDAAILEEARRERARHHRGRSRAARAGAWWAAASAARPLRQARAGVGGLVLSWAVAAPGAARPRPAGVSRGSLGCEFLRVL